MTQPQQTAYHSNPTAQPQRPANAVHQQAPANASASVKPVDTVYVDAQVIDSPTRGTAPRTQTRQQGGTTFSTFTWSSVDGFERGWNNAYQEKVGSDPYANSMPNGSPRASKAEQNRGNLLGGLAQTLAGGAIALVGIPMLILPGPGLLAIGLGGVLAAGGVKKMLGR